MLCHSLIHSHSMHLFRMSIFVIVSFPILNITSCTFFFRFFSFLCWWYDHQATEMKKKNLTHLHTLKQCLYVSPVSESSTNSNDTFYFNFLFWHFSFSSCVCFNFISDCFLPPDAVFYCCFSSVLCKSKPLEFAMALCECVFRNKNIDYGKHKSSQIFHFNLQSITIGWQKKRKVKPNTAIDLKKKNPQHHHYHRCRCRHRHISAAAAATSPPSSDCSMGERVER